MHNNLPLPLRPPSSISFLIEKKYPDNLERFHSYLLYLMDFSSSHLNLYPPASNLNLTWKQHKVIRTGVRAAIRSTVADVELGGVPSRGGLTWPLAATRERERNLDGREGKSHVRVGVRHDDGAETRLPGRPSDADLAPACAGTTRQVLAKHTHPYSSLRNIYNQFQRSLLKTSQRPQ